MWIFDDDFKNWLSKDDVLRKDIFDIYKQELSSVRFYSKCLSGATYLPINNLENIYDIISNTIERDWYIAPTASNYVYNEATPILLGSPILRDVEGDFYKKYIAEYGLTLGNKFTPKRLIKDSISNFIGVDVATNEPIDLDNPPLYIDGVRLINGHRILVKNQFTEELLSAGIDPNSYFEGEFEIVENFQTSILYRYSSNENGVYVYHDGALIKEDIFNDYNTIIRLSIYVKLGDVNSERQFSLSRLKSGYFPINRQSINFKESKNWLLRNRVDYNNLYDLDFYDVIKHEPSEYNEAGFTYSIPERTIVIGEFGSIINNQSGISNIIINKYKENLRSISQTSKYYWIVGDKGTFLRVRKHDFEIKFIEVDCLCPTRKIITNLQSIDFFDDLNGVAIGELNTILITSDGGFTWDRIRIEEFNSYIYKKVSFIRLGRFFIAGENGVFIDFTKDINGWTAFKRRISKFVDDEDDYILVDDINDMIYIETDNWSLTHSFGGTVSEEKEILLLTCNDSKIILVDLGDSLPTETSFFYLDLEKNYGDIVNIANREGSDEIYFTATGNDADGGIFKFQLSDFQIIGLGDPISNALRGANLSRVTASTYSTVFNNRIFDYDGEELILCGVNSLFKSASYSISDPDFNELDSEFNDRLKPKMLFLDYDIASKLNFFTDGGDYRLPNSVEFDYPNAAIEFSRTSIGGVDQLNWFDYWKTRQVTFKAFVGSIDNSNRIEMSQNFYYSTIPNEVTINKESIVNSLELIENLAPNISSPDHSRWYTNTALAEPTDNSFRLYLWEYLMVYRADNTWPVNLGDVIRLESDRINSNFIVNRIENLGSSKYIYMFSEFNQNIIKDISLSNVRIRNLNNHNNINNFINNFNKHPLSLGYSVIKDSEMPNKLIFSAKFNNITAYYNMSTKITSNGVDYNMLYNERFLNFGYTPNYNILDYLMGIDSRFNTDKEYLSMPIYKGVPLFKIERVLTEINRGSIYIDQPGPETFSLGSNKLIFGSELEFEWVSLFSNTFCDIEILDGLGQKVLEIEKVLINRKYKLENFGEFFKEDVYIIELNKFIDVSSIGSDWSINIISRRKLGQISNDLSELNGIHRPPFNKEYKSYNGDDIEFDIYQSSLNSRINTDSYAKILLSDLLTNRSISAILFIDYKNELSMNITRVESERFIEIYNTYNNGGKLGLFAPIHGLKVGDYIILGFDDIDGERGSKILNPQYTGYRNVISVIDTDNFVVDIDWGNDPLIGNDLGVVKFIKRDPFLNYQPVDITDIGTDKSGVKAIELRPYNTTLSGRIVSLVRVDFGKFRFRLIDGLNIETLAANYGWVYEAEISNAVLGTKDGDLIWYSGRWECGRWFGGRWLSGTWISGDWYGGNWESKLIKDNWISVEVDDKSSNTDSSVWLNGRWFGGNWENGTWFGGRWYSGTWKNGLWLNGIWNDGTWEFGKFTRGVWVSGQWNSGIFNTQNGPSYWLGGRWNSGDFENGIWYDGIFDEKNGESRFGIKSYNTRNAIWNSGNWISGSFHSRINFGENGSYATSLIHKYSIWKTGTWSGGNFYGGIAYNIDFKSGVWYGGVVKDIQVIGFRKEPVNNNIIVLNGNFIPNIGQKVSIIGSRVVSDWELIGSNENPKEYTILNYKILGKYTEIYVDSLPIDTAVSETETGLRLVSKFRNCNWKSGVWTNGIYENGLWEGGIWFDGVFSANWNSI
jgi:hypothetical protein